MTVLPGIFGDPFTGLLVSVIIYAVGGGLLEVLVSPVMESCPSDNKEKAMSLLHSFYCWGHVGVVLISTVFFRAVGIGYWPVLAGHMGADSVDKCGSLYKSADHASDGGGRKRHSLKAAGFHENVLGPADHDGLRRCQ